MRGFLAQKVPKKSNPPSKRRRDEVRAEARKEEKMKRGNYLEQQLYTQRVVAAKCLGVDVEDIKVENIKRVMACVEKGSMPIDRGIVLAQQVQVPRRVVGRRHDGDLPEPLPVGVVATRCRRKLRA